jgi:hypothetical protein
MTRLIPPPLGRSPRRTRRRRPHARPAHELTAKHVPCPLWEREKKEKESMSTIQSPKPLSGPAKQDHVDTRLKIDFILAAHPSKSAHVGAHQRPPAATSPPTPQSTARKRRHPQSTARARPSRTHAAARRESPLMHLRARRGTVLGRMHAPTAAPGAWSHRVDLGLPLAA